MKNLNLVILAIAVLISIAGILSVYSSTYQKTQEPYYALYQRQIFWVGLGLVLFAIVSNIRYRRLWGVANFAYILALILLLLVFILGTVRLGAQRWLRFAWFNFQPSEIAKLSMVIFLARRFSEKPLDSVIPLMKKSGMMQGLILPFILTAIPVVFILDQPDLGSGAMILAIFLAMLYLSGIRIRYIILFLLLIILLTPFLWHFLRGYQRDRLMVFLNPNVDPLGAGYTVIQAKIAIGSGGFFGKGWLSGTQGQLHFLPESHTDFIFATFAEEWGLFGAVALLFLYYMLISCGIRIALRTNDSFGRLLAFGISLLLGIQVLVNIAMNLGLAPVVGLPLPLMSYGGSSIAVTFIALGILANISKTRGVF